MKVSIITVCFNSEQTIKDCIESVLSQSYPGIEYIIVDGQSTDQTMAIVAAYKDRVSHIISEPDEGLYDAINKGIALASGDVVGILNSDDIFADEQVIAGMVDSLGDNDVIYGDVAFYRPDDLNRMVRYYSSRSFSPKKLAQGMMPAHPSMYVRKQIFDDHGCYDQQYKIAADFDFVARIFSIDSLKSVYLPRVFVKMRLGGVSTQGLKSNLLLNKEILHICKKQGIKTSWLRVLSKYPEKLLGFFKRTA